MEIYKLLFNNNYTTIDFEAVQVRETPKCFVLPNGSLVHKQKNLGIRYVRTKKEAIQAIIEDWKQELKDLKR